MSRSGSTAVAAGQLSVRASTRRTDRLILIAVAAALLHHTDHVMRWDHSGFPFRSDVSPFTVSLLVYPLFAIAYRAKEHRSLRAGLLGFIAVATQLAHIFAETPTDQYRTWANGRSDFPGAHGHPNLLHVTAPFLGWLAVLVSIALSITLFAATLSAVADWRLSRNFQADG